MDRALVALLTLVAAAAALVADEYPIKVYPCPRLDAPPAIDGTLNDACWAKAPVVSGFTLYNKPKLMDVQTSFRIGYDDGHLYLGVHCDEPKAAQLTPSHAGRDSSQVFRGEAIEVFLDPRHDHADYYQLAVSLAGSLYDGFKHDAFWNGAARVAAKVVAGGWELEMAVPWTDLGLDAPTPGTVLGFNVCRDRHAGGAREWSNWAQTMANFHDPIRFAHLVLSPTEAVLGKLSAEFRKGDRSGPILIYGEAGYAGKAYLAMAQEALRRLEATLAALQAEADKELLLGPNQEVAECLETAKALVEPYRGRIGAKRALDAAAWTRLSVEMTRLEAQLGTLLWDARLATLLKEI